MLNETEHQVLRKHLDFWENLEPEQKELLAQNTFHKTFAKGDQVYSPEAECLGLLLLLQGELRVYILSEDGREVTLYRMRAGDTCILSASCILKSITFDVYVVAEQETKVLLVNIAAFGRVSKDNIYVENFTLRNAVERFSEVMWSMEQILFLSIDRRLAGFLLDEGNKQGSLIISLTHEQIARYIGSAREVVSRMLKGFQEEGLVEQSRGKIQIVDKKRLEEIL